MNNLVERIDAEIENRSLLKHPFYKMWTEGKLSIEDLWVYSKEYFQMVKAVPKFVENIARLTVDPSVKAGVTKNLREESEHIEPWIRFATAMGVPRSELLNYTGATNTTSAVSEVAKLTTLSFEEGVAAMYAYEKELPRVSMSKIEGLKKFYSMDSADATKYFEIHEKADVEHAALWRAILKNVPTDMTEAVFNAAVGSIEAQNKILDSVLEKTDSKYRGN
jgi:pyrroloquinoline-quinone synthase